MSYFITVRLDHGLSTFFRQQVRVLLFFLPKMTATTLITVLCTNCTKNGVTEAFILLHHLINSINLSFPHTTIFTPFTECHPFYYITNYINFSFSIIYLPTHPTPKNSAFHFHCRIIPINQEPE